MLDKIIPKIYKTSVHLLKILHLEKYAKPMDRFYFDNFLSEFSGKVFKNALGRSKSTSQVDTFKPMDNEVKDRLGIWGTNGCHVTPGTISGLDRINNPGLNKSLAFTIEERQMLGIHGLLPPVVKTQEQQIEHCKICLQRLEDPLDKYMYLIDLLDFNEKLLYALVRKNITEIMPIMYTPTVGTACLNWGLVYRRPRGIYITAYDRGHIYDILKNWPEPDVRVIVVTDGERILGLGDQGACGMGIPVGKLALYTAFGGIKPHHCLPITIDVGTNNEAHLKDQQYPGMKEKRQTGPKYDSLIDEFMCAVVQKWGRNCLVQFEDFGNKNAFRLLEKYRNQFCTFNDDIQGTASVVVAGILSALRITKTKLSDNVIVFFGAGEANIGIANLCVMAMTSDRTMTKEQAMKNIWMIDSQGLVIKSRENLEDTKKPFAQDHKEIKTLLEVVKTIKPHILIGAAAVGGAFSTEVLNEMSKNCNRPIIFALSNPTNKAECTAEEAYRETKGNAIFASGSPFPCVKYDGKTYTSGQGNNAYIFPAVGLAAMCGGIPSISDDYFLIAAEALASLVTDSDLSNGCIYPPLTNLLECSTKIATRLVEYAYRKGAATVMPEPENKEAFIRSQMYSTDYEPAVPSFYPLTEKK